MTIDANTRSCPRCGTILPTELPSICRACDRVSCPPIGEWPTDLKIWLMQMLVTRFMAPNARGSAQRRWESLLRATIAGHIWGGRRWPMAVDPADAYPVATQEVAKWVAAGRPSLIE